MPRDMVPINVRDPFWKDPFFSSTWDDFDKMRQDMMARNKDFWSKVDTDFKNFDEEVKKAHREMDTQMSPFRPHMPNWAIPDNTRTELTPFQRTGDELIKVKTDDTKLEVSLDVSDYKPEELKVTTIDNVLSIEGKHEQQREEDKGSYHGRSSVMKQFSRKFTLPAGSDPNDVVSNLSSDGILIVTAPKKGAIGTNVPIQQSIK